MLGDTEFRVIRTIADQLGMDQDTVATTPRAHWHMDSLDDVEILMALEDEFGIEIHDDEGAKWQTVADVVAYITRAAA